MELKGSKTEKNLETAFAGESQARNKYTYFAAVAKEEGFEQIAGIFLETAENEREHAKREFDFLKGTQMYADFGRVAREEGFGEIAGFFKEVAEVEEEHEKRYLALLQNVKEGKVFKKDKAVRWKCHSCGWFYNETEAPNECPICKSPKSGFGVLDEGYYKAYQ